jgi:hypothetical protein
MTPSRFLLRLSTGLRRGQAQSPDFGLDEGDEDAPDPDFAPVFEGELAEELEGELEVESDEEDPDDSDAPAEVEAAAGEPSEDSFAGPASAPSPFWAPLVEARLSLR